MMVSLLSVRSNRVLKIIGELGVEYENATATG